jgi:DNA mismatch repair protein MSH3
MGCRTSSSNAIRVERIDDIPDFDSAFAHLTKFYKQKRSTMGTNGRGDGEIDMTEDSDEDSGTAEDKVSKEEQNINTDPMDLAAGLPGEHPFARHRPSLPHVAEEAVLALVDFPKQVVVALSTAVKYMKSERLHSSQDRMLTVHSFSP